MDFSEFKKQIQTESGDNVPMEEAPINSQNNVSSGAQDSLQNESEIDNFYKMTNELSKNLQSDPQSNSQPETQNNSQSYPQSNFQSETQNNFQTDSLNKDRLQIEKEEIQEQQIPQQSSNFDPQKFLREKSGIIPVQPSNVCPDCENTGIVKESNGSVHTCWKCLQEGKLDCHSENVPDNSHIRL